MRRGETIADAVPKLVPESGIPMLYRGLDGPPFVNNRWHKLCILYVGKKCLLQLRGGGPAFGE
jgi:hypothetical protein